jgi:predicted dehydrogenase
MAVGPKQAPDGEPIRAGLIGCGGRGTGAAGNFLDSGPNLQLVALADVFQDRLDNCRQQLKAERGVEIADNMCFTGFDAYQKLLETDVNYVIQATPPHFRPQHFEAIVQARKNVFLEKPLGVDPVGVRAIMATAERADAFELCVGTGTQFRHQPSFIETFNRVQDGAIGEILAARGYSLRGQLWYKVPQPEWSEMEAMMRDWVNWQWLSGDHIVEQHIHGLDVMFWFTGQFPKKAVGEGGRARRVTGDQFDFFSVDYEMDNGIHIDSRCRQIDGCTNNISRWVLGTKGYTNCQDTIFAHDGSVVWTYKGGEAGGDSEDNSPYVQEHIDLIAAIRTGNRVNEAAATAKSTLGAVMARETAYTGLEVTWDEMMESTQRLGPTEYALGPVDINKAVPVPGIQKEG